MCARSFVLRRYAYRQFALAGRIEASADIRAAAAAAERLDLMQMWTGQEASLIRSMPAAGLVETLASEAGLA
jgi:hypothetical protein